MANSNSAPTTKAPPSGDPGPPPWRWDMVPFFWPFLRDHRHKIWAIAVISILTGATPALMGLLPMLFTSNWVPGRVHWLWWGLGAMVLLQLFITLLQFFHTAWAARVSQEFTKNLRLAIFRKIGQVPAAAMHAQSIGALAQRSTGDVMRLQQWVMPLLPMAVGSLAQLFFMAVALLLLGPLYFLIALAASPFIYLVLRILNRRVGKLSRECQLRSEGLLTQFIEGAEGYRDLVASGRFGLAADRFGAELDGMSRAAQRMSIAGFMAGLPTLLGFTLLLFGYYFVSLGRGGVPGDMVYLGKVMSFAGLLSGIQGPVMSLARFATETSLAAPSFHEVRRLLTAPEVRDVAAGARPQNGEIRLENVTFSYHGGPPPNPPPGFSVPPPVLQNLTFTIPHGSFTAIVGQTGSGKTTLFHLLLRLLDPVAGRVWLGGVPLNTISLVELRQHVGFIPQHPFIFDTSIKDNLLLGIDEASLPPGRLEHAVQLAQLEDLVHRRGPEGGLEARVGPGGATLSGGERQRIALGRIFLRDPQVIVCDEYTANIDNATARLIQHALATEFAGRTRIVITHQLYTVRGADQILVLENGTLTDSGTHAQLLEKAGLYRDLWEVQRLS